MGRKFLLLMIGGSLAFVYSSAQDAYPPSVRMKVEDMSRYTLEEKASNDKMYALAVPGNGYGYAEDIRMQSYLQEDKEDYWFISAKTNLLFVAALTLNLGVEISPWPHWSLDIPVWYSPYNITEDRCLRLLAVQPEIRWWPESFAKGHFIGLHSHVAGFNVAINDNGRYQDPNKALWGFGVSYGYKCPLGKAKRWGIEFTLGVGFARYSYDAYRNWENGPLFKSGSGTYWGLTRAGINLSYTWNIRKKR